ncbi:c-type cytochrome [Flavobacterium sp. SM2513]|uniref:c-type cytochrome n=1 Tax=Flavobacterium sp. SM2513 TaxID=3424766 RepID=UPI003D7F5B88
MQKIPAITTRNFFIFLVCCFLGYSVWIYTVPYFKPNMIPPQEQALSSNGRLVFQKYNCHTCHQIYGLGGYLGPDLTNVYSRRQQNEEYLKAIVHSGVRQMPAFDLSAVEIKELLAFLKNLDATGSADIQSYQPEAIGTFTVKEK